MRASLLVFLAVSACARPSTAPVEAARPEVAPKVVAEPMLSAAVPVAPAVGQAAPDFTLPSLGSDGAIGLSDRKGQVVLVSFWASWCGPCRHEIPALEAVWKGRRGQGFSVIGVSVDDAREDALGFLSMFPVTYPQSWDQGGHGVADAWGVQNLPASFLIGQDGVVRHHHIGWNAGTIQETTQEIDALLAQR